MSWILHPHFHLIGQCYRILCQDSLLHNLSLVRPSSRNKQISPYFPGLVGGDVAFHHFSSWKSCQDDEKMNGSQ